MHLTTIQEVLASKLLITTKMLRDHETGELKEVEKKAIPEDLYLQLRGRARGSKIGLSSYEDYFSMVCCMLNYGLSPSPRPFDDLAAAMGSVQSATTQKALKGLLVTASTHILKFVDIGLPVECIFNKIPPTGSGSGVSSDTMSPGTVFSMGDNAGQLSGVPFWMSEFVMPDGSIASHFDAMLYRNNSVLLDWIERAFTALNAAPLLDEYREIVEGFRETEVAEAIGKIVRFPLEGDKYLSISPIPSATLIKRMSDGYFDAIHRRNAIPKSERGLSVFAYPSSVVVAVGGGNPQNGGSLAADIGGKARALQCLISELPQGGNGSLEGQLLRKLASGSKTLLTFPAHILKYLRTKPEVARHRRNWERYMTEAIAESTNDLLMLRNEGLPIAVDRARFRFPIERDFVLRGLDGDEAARSLTPSDLHAMALHIRDQFLYAARSSTKALVLDQSQSDLIYQVAIDHLR